MIRRTTIAADAADLAYLEAEAKRREVALTQVLAEAVSEKANALRKGRKFSWGTGSSGGGFDAKIDTAEPVARPVNGEDWL
jgi:hypothetical protein